MSDFQPGEIISIAVPKARIESVTTEGHDSDETLVARALVIGDDGKPYYIAVPLEWDTVTVERVAPAEWPPQPGDLWRDQDGDLWHGLLVDDDDTDDETYVVLRPGRTSKHPSFVNSDNDGVRRTYGPLTLVYREGGGES